LEDLENSKKAVNKAVAGVDEIIERFERRINEISEVQRLNDERFRQEWNAFKADDLKRWTNYLLNQEEQLHAISQQISSNAAQIEALDDITVKTQDDVDRLSRETIKHVQSILQAYQDSIQSIAPLAERKAS
jgi:TolA-binding protein